MKAKIGLLVIGLLLLGFTAWAQDTQTPSITLTPLEEVLQIFYEGDIVVVEYNETGRTTLEWIIEVFKNELGVPESLNEESETNVSDFEVALDQKDLINKLSQTYYTLANSFLAGEPNEEEMYVRGKHWGLKSLRMSPEFAQVEQESDFAAAVEQENDYAALYWANSNWLRVSQFNKLAAVFAGAAAKSEVILMRCLEIKPEYMAYGPYRSLGAFWGGLPKLPAGHHRKNFEKARAYLCRVVNEPVICEDCEICEGCVEYYPADEYCDEYLENRTFFAEFYLIEMGAWEEAKKVLESVLADPIGDKYPFYNALSQENARELLLEVEKHL